MKKSDKIFVAGHNGLVGSALVRRLTQGGYSNLILRNRAELDLLDTVAVKKFYAETKPDVVILAAAKVGGIFANNTYRADFIYQNLTIQNNVIWGAFENKVRNLVFLGSSCIYPKFAPQPIKEEHLLTGELEITNQPYAIAKIAGLELVQSLRKQYGCNYFSVMPCNLYGKNDNFDLQNAHVLPALLRRIHEEKLKGSKELIVWGTGTPLREFLFSDDCADAIVFLLDNLENLNKKIKDFSHINIGSGQEVSILELTNMLSDVIGFSGNIKHDLSKPDGTPRKLIDSSFINKLGWVPKTPLKVGLEKTYNWYEEDLKLEGISILIPTRKRPKNLHRFVSTINAVTTNHKNVEIIFGVDKDDTSSIFALNSIKNTSKIDVRCVVVNPYKDGGINLSYIWNQCYAAAKYPIIGYFGDDVIFKTKNWDLEVGKEFKKDKCILLSCNDVHLWCGKESILFFTHKKVHEKFGFYLDETFRRNWSDTFLDRIFRSVNKIRYRHDIITEHLREKDEIYMRMEHLKDEDHKKGNSLETRMKIKKYSNMLLHLKI